MREMVRPCSGSKFFPSKLSRPKPVSLSVVLVDPLLMVERPLWLAIVATREPSEGSLAFFSSGGDPADDD